jgi:hypothetical protein
VPFVILLLSFLFFIGVIITITDNGSRSIALMLFALSISNSGFAWQIAAMRKRVLSLRSLQDVSQSLSVTEEELQKAADEKGIKPLYKINGRYLYNPDDFEDTKRLLRPSKAPESTDLLLHPVSAATSQDRAETLLRPTPSPADTSQITVSNPTAPEVQTLQQNTQDD